MPTEAGNRELDAGADLVTRLRKEASLGNNVYSPWPQKLLNDAADALAALAPKGEAELVAKLVEAAMEIAGYDTFQTEWAQTKIKQDLEQAFTKILLASPPAPLQEEWPTNLQIDKAIDAFVGDEDRTYSIADLERYRRQMRAALLAARPTGEASPRRDAE